MAAILARAGSLWCAAILTCVIAASAYDCPVDWEAFGGHCYLFVFDPARTYTLASTACQVKGAYLLSVNSAEEHNFISQWLVQHRVNSLYTTSRWWTSGIGAGTELQWEGDGRANTLDESTMWAEEGEREQGERRVVYRFSPLTNNFLWGRQTSTEKSPFICEVSQTEADTIFRIQRDFAFGTELTHSAYAPQGPRFVRPPRDLMIVGRLEFAFIDCVAEANPPASYVWYRVTAEGGAEVVSQEQDQRYSLTNGRFILQTPDESKDEGSYFCEASNTFGTIQSHRVRISFGYVEEFSNNPPGDVIAEQYMGAYIDCNAPMYKPSVIYQWYRGTDTARFIRTLENPHLFVSKSGGLYFSETERNSQGVYHCIVTLSAPSGVTMATKQPPSRVSLGIHLKVEGEAATNFGPEIHNDFPAVFPSTPLRGNDLYLECFAYGKLPMYYTWRRDNGQVPRRAQLQDHGRTLFLPDAQLEDSGNYTCRVDRASVARDEKTLALVVRAVPYFIFPLRDQHVDVNSTFSIRCEAMGLPLPTYAWLKNGRPLTSTPGDVEVRGNVVTIANTDPSRHIGMYQCRASNVYGTRDSTCQVRVLEFKPTFVKRPLDSSQMATVGGNVTIVCQPEAAPRPTFAWFRNGAPLDLTPGVEGRVTLLTNGNLRVTGAQLSDQGTYTCRAENSMGWAESSGRLTIVSRTTITVRPTDTEVIVNNTAFLNCEASFDSRHQDLAYAWYLNGHRIDPSKEVTYIITSRAGLHGLYIQGAQFKHSGRYQCKAITVDDETTASSYLTVRGPPSEPAGVYGSVVGNDVILTWTPGNIHGSGVISYVIEHKSNFAEGWSDKVDEVTEGNSVSTRDSGKRTVRVTGLSPGSMYEFRVKAVNKFGVGDTSVPSELLKIPDAPPIVAPDGIEPYNSSVGTLAFKWNQLKPEDLTGSGRGYKLYWRKKKADEYRETLWQMGRVDATVGKLFTLVGRQNFYLEYEVKVAAFNSLGDGPNSTVATVMSQEDLPLATPENVWGEEVNATAMMVYWDPVVNTRQNMRGKLRGFQINWWLEGEPSFITAVNIHCEDCTGGMVIGLAPNADFWVNVQTFNTAGLGPKGEDYRISTGLLPPTLYPEFVTVQSHPGESVYVTWRGVSIKLDEAPLTGYKLRWWPSTENIRTANDTVIPEKRTWGVIRGIETGVVYALRVLGYSDGGDGKKSPTVYFTLEGQVMYNFERTEIMAAGSDVRASFWILLLCCWFCFVNTR